MYDEALRRIEEAKKSNYLNLSFIGLKTLPPEIGQLQALTELDLSRNQLSSVPPEIGQLQALNKLYLTGIQIKYKFYIGNYGVLPLSAGKISVGCSVFTIDNLLKISKREIDSLLEKHDIQATDEQVADWKYKLSQQKSSV